MEQLNFHKKKLYSLIAAGVALISLILPWITISFAGLGGGSINGFRSWGLLSFLGIVGVAIACLMGDKTKDFNTDFKKIAMASFGAIGLGALIFFLRINSFGGLGIVSSGIGLWICLISGIAGLVWVAGLVKTNTSPPPKN